MRLTSSECVRISLCWDPVLWEGSEGQITLSASDQTGLIGDVTMVHLTSQLLQRYYGGNVVIRMALRGCTNRPFYLIVAAYNKRARDGKHLDKLGSYDPMPNVFNEKLVSLNIERIKYWMASGAQVTKPVAKLFGLAGFFPLHPMTITEAERLRKAKEKATEQTEEHSEEVAQG